jgi:hypothetical protein
MGRRLAVPLPPADQARYRETAWADTKAILGHRSVVILVAVVALAGTEASTFLSATELGVFEKIVIAALAAGVGVLIVLVPILYLGALAAAPHRQQQFRTKQLDALERQRATDTDHERTEAQFAGAIRVATDVLPYTDVEAIRLSWFRTTKSLVGDVFGPLEAARLDSRLEVEARRERLEELADRLRDSERAPSSHWDDHMTRVERFRQLLHEMEKAGEALKARMMAKEEGVGLADAQHWLSELHDVLDLMPDFTQYTYAHDPVVAAMTVEYEGIDDPEINRALTLLDRRLMYIPDVLPPLRTYLWALTG